VFSHFFRQKNQKNKRWLDGTATFHSGSGKFSVFSEDRNLLGFITINYLPCVGSELDFSGLLVTINDELPEEIPLAIDPTPPLLTPQPPPCSEFLLPHSRDAPLQRTSLSTNSAVAPPIFRSDDEILRLLMPRGMKLADTSASKSHCGGSESNTFSGTNTHPAVDATSHSPYPPVTNKPPSPSGTLQVNCRLATSFRLLHGPKASNAEFKSHADKTVTNVDVPKASYENAVGFNHFQEDSAKHLHQTLKQPRACAPTYFANSFETFRDTLHQGLLQLPLDLDPVELSKLFEKRHICVPDSFASLSGYSSTFRSALWEGEARFTTN
jgi:hypothetical protein